MGGLREAAFGGPEQVLKYLARYTHRVAISNSRLVSMEDGCVTFRWKDYADGNQSKEMKLEAVEFIRRFLLHVLPSGFVCIRQFGFLANRARGKKLALCRSLLGALPASAEQPINVRSEEKVDKQDRKAMPGVRNRKHGSHCDCTGNFRTEAFTAIGFFMSSPFRQMITSLNRSSLTDRSSPTATTPACPKPPLNKPCTRRERLHAGGPSCSDVGNHGKRIRLA